MSPAKKRRRLHRHNKEQRESSAENLQLVVASEKTVVVIPDKVLSLTEIIEKGHSYLHPIVVAKRCCRFFRVRVNENDDDDD